MNETPGIGYHVLLIVIMFFGVVGILLGFTLLDLHMFAKPERERPIWYRLLIKPFGKSQNLGVVMSVIFISRVIHFW
jgi:hypothetical protein